MFFIHAKEFDRIMYFRVKTRNEWHESFFHQLKSFPPRLFRIFVSPAQTFTVLARPIGGIKAQVSSFAWLGQWKCQMSLLASVAVVF